MSETPCTSQPGIVCPGGAVKPAPDASRRRNHLQCCPHWRGSQNTGCASFALTYSDKLPLVDEHHSRSILIFRLADGTYPDLKTVKRIIASILVFYCHQKGALPCHFRIFIHIFFNPRVSGLLGSDIFIDWKRQSWSDGIFLWSKAQNCKP